MELGKVPPHDLEAEQAILGSMLTDKDAVTSSAEVLKVEDFYREDNRMIYSAILNLYNRAEPIDIITVKAELEAMGKFEQVGGLEYLAELPDKVPTTANALKYIKIVEEKATLRSLIKTANEIIELGYDPTEDVEDIMAGAEKKIFNIVQNKGQKDYSPIKDILVDSFIQLEELYNRKQHVTGVPSGFFDLDYKTSGFHGSELILIAARPAMGKSAFVLNIATNAAMKANVPVVIFSLEMAKEQMVNRILCSEAMVDSNKVRTGKLEEDDWTQLAGAVGPLSEANIYIDDTPGISVMKIMAKCRKLKAEKQIGMIIIDYLQLVQGSGKRNGSREQEIAEISRSLKILAKELNVPVIALSQLSRAVEQRPDHRPMLSDLRESGSIEQDADIVMFLYRDDYYTKEQCEKPGIAEVILAKHRGGSTGKIELRWVGEYTKFLNLERRFDD
jgi:replicative DNA helicase